MRSYFLYAAITASTLTRFLPGAGGGDVGSLEARVRKASALSVPGCSFLSAALVSRAVVAGVETEGVLEDLFLSSYSSTSELLTADFTS